jgi:hypothetical protein
MVKVGRRGLGHTALPALTSVARRSTLDMRRNTFLGAVPAPFRQLFPLFRPYYPFLFREE